MHRSHLIWNFLFCCLLTLFIISSDCIAFPFPKVFFSVHFFWDIRINFFFLILYAKKLCFFTFQKRVFCRIRKYIFWLNLENWRNKINIIQKRDFFWKFTANWTSYALYISISHFSSLKKIKHFFVRFVYFYCSLGWNIWRKKEIRFQIAWKCSIIILCLQLFIAIVNFEEFSAEICSIISRIACWTQ